MQFTGKTKIVGVIGAPVEHSRSPQMHNAAFKELRLNYVYVAFHVKKEDVQEAISGFKAINVAGINVTIPHKQSVIPLIDSLSKEAEIIGAVNTLVFSEGKIEGHNTDARGFIQAMKEEGADVPKGESVVILGAGGATRAVAVSLALEGVKKITIANRTEEKAVKLAGDISEKTGVAMEGIGLSDAKLPQAIKEGVLLVNTASSSMDVAYPLLIDPNWLHEDLVVYDIIYTPPVTRLMKAAEARGLKTIGGMGMLVHQGAIAFQLWTKQFPPVDTMRRALMEALTSGA